MKGNYNEQVKRVIRSFNKLPKSFLLKEVDDEIRDDFFHFFQDCYHLKDWIKNDGNLNLNIKNEVEKFINSAYYLKIVADIANATKHLTLTEKPRIDSNIDLSNVVVYSGYPKKKEAVMLTIDMIVGNKSKAIEGTLLALKSLEEWNIFLDKFKLGHFAFKKIKKQKFNK